MDGWDSWNSPDQSTAKPTIASALVAAREASRREREIVWDRGMPQESRERITASDPRWNQAEEVRDPTWMGYYGDDEEDEY